MCCDAIPVVLSVGKDPPLYYIVSMENEKKNYGLKTVLDHSEQKKFFPFKMKKKLENFHQILRVRKQP